MPEQAEQTAGGRKHCDEQTGRTGNTGNFGRIQRRPYGKSE